MTFLKELPLDDEVQAEPRVEGRPLRPLRPLSDEFGRPFPAKDNGGRTCTTP